MNFFETVRNLKESQSPGDIAHELSDYAHKFSSRAATDRAHGRPGEHLDAAIHHEHAGFSHGDAALQAKDSFTKKYHLKMANHHREMAAHFAHFDTA
jgi:hypothetical protein